LLTTNTAFVPTGAGPPESAGATPSISVRYVAGLNRIYVQSGGTITLSANSAPPTNAPLCLIDPIHHVWFLSARLVVVNGTTLKVHGTAIGGDADELRLRSDNSMADGSCSSVEADWGTLDFQNVKITSWDQLTAAPDTEYAVYQRTFIAAR